MNNNAPKAGLTERLTRGWKEGAQLSVTLLGVLFPLVSSWMILAQTAGWIVFVYALLYAIATARSVADMNRDINSTHHDATRLAQLDLPKADQSIAEETIAREQAEWQEQLTQAGRYTAETSPAWMGLITGLGLLMAASAVLLPVGLGGLNWLPLSVLLALLLIAAAQMNRQAFRWIDLVIDWSIPAAAAGLGYWVIGLLHSR